MKNKIMLILISMLIIIDSLYCLSFQELVKKLEEKDEKISKLKADYIQLINFLDLNETYIIKARFIYVSPKKLRIDIDEPFKQIIVVNDKSIYVKDVLNDTIYYSDSDKYFSKQKNYFPLIFSKNKKYKLSDLVKKTGLKFVNEEENFYVLSTRYAKGKTYKDKKEGLRPKETRFILWINKETLFPEKVNMISEKYVVETILKNYETEFEVDESLFEIEKSSNTKIIKFD